MILEVQELCSGYGALQVLYNVSFHVDPGEVVALMGSNGAGKTTTFAPSRHNSRSPTVRSPLTATTSSGAPTESLVRRGIALVPEGRGMLRDLSVEQNLELGAYTVKDKQLIADGFTRAFECFRSSASAARKRPAACRVASSRCSPSRGR